MPGHSSGVVDPRPRCHHGSRSGYRALLECPSFCAATTGLSLSPPCMQDRLKAQRIKTLYNKPGSPWENGCIESFHDKLRDECLNCELFGNLREARVILESWRVQYNESRPHSALGYRTPSEYARNGTNRFDGAARPPNPRRLPQQAFGGTKDQCHKMANKRTAKH
jgi:Integrase core domain